MKYVYKTSEGSFIVTAENFLFASCPSQPCSSCFCCCGSRYCGQQVWAWCWIFADFIGFGGTAGQAAKACLQGAVHSLPIIVVFGTLFLYAWAEESGSLRRLRMLLALLTALFFCALFSLLSCAAPYLMS